MVGELIHECLVRPVQICIPSRTNLYLFPR